MRGRWDRVETEERISWSLRRALLRRRWVERSVKGVVPRRKEGEAEG